MAYLTHTAYMYANCGLTSLSLKTFVSCLLIGRICVLVRNKKKKKRKHNKEEEKETFRLRNWNRACSYQKSWALSQSNQQI